MRVLQIAKMCQLKAQSTHNTNSAAVPKEDDVREGQQHDATWWPLFAISRFSICWASGEKFLYLFPSFFFSFIFFFVQNYDAHLQRVLG
jgi:hypothetical protein